MNRNLWVNFRNFVFVAIADFKDSHIESHTQKGRFLVKLNIFETKTVSKVSNCPLNIENREQQ